MHVKHVLDDMVYLLNEELSNKPYANAFFLSYTKDEYCDDTIPDLEHLRQCFKNSADISFYELKEELFHY